MKSRINGIISPNGYARATKSYLIALTLLLFALPGLLSAQTLLHRYSFISNADDSVGTANGTLVPPGSSGSPATINNGLTLPGGGGGGYSGYLSLPSGILTDTTNLTIECWVTQNTGNTWATIWCFDNSTVQNFQLCPDPGRNNGNMIVDNNPNNNERDLATSVSFPNSSEQYVAVTVNAANLTENLYYNGVLAGTLDFPNASYIPGTYGGAAGTDQNWLGNDTYGDTQFQGTIYELRIWNGALSQRQIAASAVLGPSTLVTNLTPTSVSLAAGPSVIISGTEQAAVTVHLRQTGSSDLPATSDATNWTSSDPGVLAVNSSGLVSGVSVGSATVSATVAGVTATSGTITVTGPPVLEHRYSFVSDASDSVGGPTWNGTLVTGTDGTTPAINNGVSLPGNTTGGFGESGYVSFPSGILTNTTSLTVECWATQNSQNTWAELWDFGNSGSENFALIPYPQNNGFDMSAAFNPPEGEVDLFSHVLFPTNSEQDVCLTYNNFTRTGDLYDNGVLVGTATFPSTAYAPGSIGGAAGTTNNMLGNDVYGDYQFNGTVYEFRIWNGAKSPLYAKVAAAAGPSVVVTNLTPTSVSVTVTNTNMIGSQTQQAAVTGNFAQVSGINVTEGATNWTSSNPAVLIVDSSGLITAVSGGTATVSAAVNGVVGTSATITVTHTAPTITEGPANQTKIPGETASFGVQALGGDLSYQWSFDSTPIAGATNTTLTVTNVAFADAGTYSVSVANDLGTNNVSATLAVVSAYLQHRYSFISDASDSVGGATWNGILVPGTSGINATINGGLVLPGNTHGGFGYSGYLSLPSGILTNTTSLTVECWLTQNSQNTWAEAWDFGSAGGIGVQNFGLIPYPADNNNNLEVAFTPPEGGIELASDVPFPDGSEQYVAVTYNKATLTGDLYTNGTLVATQTFPDATYTPGTYSGGATLDMLGNDVYGDQQFDGTINEFRIWDGAVSPLYEAVAAAAGPSVVVTNLTPTAVTVGVTNSSMIVGQTQQASVVADFPQVSGVLVTGSATNWVSSDSTVLTVDGTGMITAVGSGSATISATVNGVTGTSPSISVPTSAPVITQEPETNEILLAGATLRISVANVGNPPFVYRWDYNGGATPISIATNDPTLIIPNIQLSDAGSYTCVVSNQYGTASSSGLNLTVVTPTPYQQALVSYGPVGYWPLDEASGTTAYDVIGGNNGTYFGGYTLGNPGPTNSFFGASSAAGFDGFSSYVDIPGARFNITNAVTAVAWVDLTAAPVFGGVIGHGDPSWRMTVNGSGQPGGNDGTSASADATDPIASPGILDGNWHMVAYSYTGVPGQANNGSLYVDGLLVDHNTIVTAPVGDDLDVWIGGSPDYGLNRLLPAYIANAAVFNQALTAAQIQGMYNGQFVAGPQYITITHSGSNVVLKWQTGTLLQAPSVLGPWTTNTTAVSPYTVPAASGSQFFRLLVNQ